MFKPAYTLVNDFTKINVQDFDPDANTHTHKQTIFFHMTLLTVEGISKEKETNNFLFSPATYRCQCMTVDYFRPLNIVVNA